MALGRRRTRLGVPATFLVYLSLTLDGCVEDEEPAEAAKREGRLLEVDVTLKAMVWNSGSDTLYGLEREGKRLVRIDPDELTGIER